MTIQIRNIKESLNIFDVNRSSGKYFHKQNGESILMTTDEQESFKATNFVVGYAGKDIKLSSWADKQGKGLNNINIDMKPAELRQYLWTLVQTDFATITDRKLRIAQGYYTLQQFKTIAETSKTQDITFWVLSGYDQPNAELLVRFVNYLASR
ncbi:hypothetical protein QUB68_25040 [Microcoleus sp. A006_D1]|uniref:hypothetical protein n=1 Tax=Microcoleus sp. A006_D1 TaxID=3055267 RepID=UPI002FD47754